MWNDDRVELLKKHWSDGLSCSLIAARLGGVTRNAVIGKLHRMGLGGHRVAQRMIRRKRDVKAARQKERKPKYFHVRSDKKPFAPTFSGEPLPPEPERPAKLFKLIDLEDNQCRYPYGDPKSADFGFCGCKKLPGSPYCPGHHGKAFNGVPVRLGSPKGHPGRKDRGVTGSFEQRVPQARNFRELELL